MTPRKPPAWREVACPKCEVPPHVRCRTAAERAFGWEGTGPIHAARIRAAAAKAREEKR